MEAAVIVVGAIRFKHTRGGCGCPADVRSASDVSDSRGAVHAVRDEGHVVKDRAAVGRVERSASRIRPNDRLRPVRLAASVARGDRSSSFYCTAVNRVVAACGVAQEIAGGEGCVTSAIHRAAIGVVRVARDRVIRERAAGEVACTAIKERAALATISAGHRHCVRRERNARVGCRSGVVERAAISILRSRHRVRAERTVGVHASRARVDGAAVSVGSAAHSVGRKRRVQIRAVAAVVDRAAVREVETADGIRRERRVGVCAIAAVEHRAASRVAKPRDRIIRELVVVVSSTSRHVHRAAVPRVLLRVQLLQLVPRKHTPRNARRRREGVHRTSVPITTTRIRRVRRKRAVREHAHWAVQPNRAAACAAGVSAVRLRLVRCELAARKRLIRLRLRRNRAAVAFAVAVHREVAVEDARGPDHIAVDHQVRRAAALGGGVGVEGAVGETRLAVHDRRARAAVERVVRDQHAVAHRRA